ncbi:MAG: thioredoxin domain-containing protein [Alphaproteobacteria bacterium]|nr:thioredoxin domain-containing protein [Alphaproteobacteria bacterium]
MASKCSNKQSCLSGFLVGAAVVGAVGYGAYHLGCKNKPLGGSGGQQQEIQDIVIKVIKEKPDLIMTALNDGMQAQQDKLRIDMEKDASAMKDKLLQSSIVIGNPKADVRLLAFIDPMCPHCGEFLRISNALLLKRQDLAIHLIPIAMLGANSVALSKMMLAASGQNVDKMKTFFLKFGEKAGEIDQRPKLLKLAKESGLDVDQLEKAETAPETEKQLESNTKLAETLKIPGVPTVFGIYASGKMSIIPPTDLENFNTLIDTIKADKPIEASLASKE